MAEDKDYLGEKLHRAERAREDAYFRKLDQVLIAQMRQKDREATAAVKQLAPDLALTDAIRQALKQLAKT